MQLTVSLNGADNVGKTTQLGLLPSSLALSKVGGIHEYDRKLHDMHQKGLFKEWWWTSTDEDFVLAIFKAVASRYWSPRVKDSSGATVFDRGATMFEAVTTSVIAVKSMDHDLDKARTIMRTIIEDHRLQFPSEDLAILLKHGKNLEDSVRITMSREASADDRYTLYQQLLQEELKHQVSRGAYRHVISIATCDSIGDVQDRLRRLLFAHSQDPIFLPLLHTLDHVYAFTGLSECGKSSLAEALCNHFGTKKAFRAKMVYFSSIASERLGESVYTQSEKEQAMSLLHEIERFSRAHYWLQVISIESLHQSELTKWLKEFLGNRLKIIYIDTRQEKRMERSIESPSELLARDEMKRGRGVELIRAEADLVLDNNGPFATSVGTLLSFAARNGTRRDIKGNITRDG